MWLWLWLWLFGFRALAAADFDVASHHSQASARAITLSCLPSLDNKSRTMWLRSARGELNAVPGFLLFPALRFMHGI